MANLLQYRGPDQQVRRIDTVAASIDRCPAALILNAPHEPKVYCVGSEKAAVLNHRAAVFGPSF
jgi:hypothetical protein